MDTINSVPWTQIFSIARGIFIIANILLVVFFVFSLAKSRHYRPKFTLLPRRPRKQPTLKSEALREHWQAILRKLESGGSEAMKIAIIEADSLVGDILQRLDYTGEHLADRLAKLSIEDFPSVEKLWQAHRIRNELVHAPGFEISPSHAEEIISVYESFLKEAGVL
jgi:hypothetical protein